MLTVMNMTPSVSVRLLPVWRTKTHKGCSGVPQGSVLFFFSLHDLTLK